MTNGRKFGVHEIWLYQDDEHLYSKDETSFCVQTFDTIEEAQAYKKILESKYLRGLLPIGRGIDCFRELTFFLEKQLKKRPWHWNKKQIYSEESPEPKIIAYARSLGWGKKQIKGNEGQGYMLYLPEEVTDEQLLEIARLAQASFYKVIEYQSSQSHIYVSFHPHFWPQFVWSHIKQKGFIDSAKLLKLKQKASHKGKYEIWLLNKSNRKSKFRFESLAEAQKTASEVLVEHLKTLWDHSFFAKNYVLDWSDSPTLLINYLKNTSLFDLESILVTDENIEELKNELSSVYTKTSLEPGDTFYRVSLSKTPEEHIHELKGLVELMKIKPIEVREIVFEVNGESIKTKDD